MDEESKRIMDEESKRIIVGILFTFFVLLFLVGTVWGGNAIYKKYNIWGQEQDGRAELAKAEFNRQIAVVEANAKKESAKNLAEAEIIRARGIAEANKIISNSITTEYIKYKFVEGLNDGNTEVIYVPTEANIPILEARDVR